MSVEAAIVTLITGIVPVATLIGDRIGAAGVPQGLARPNVAYQLLGTDRTYSNDGSCDLRRGTLQVSCYADDYETAKNLAGAIADELDGYSGVVGDTEIRSLLIDDERDAPQPPTPGEGAGVAGVVLVFKIAYVAG